MEDSTSTSDETRTNTQWSRRKKHVDDLRAELKEAQKALELKEAQKIALERQVSDALVLSSDLEKTNREEMRSLDKNWVET